MSIDDMALGLPDPIEAEPGKIRSGAEDLDDLHSDMLGRSGDTDTRMRASADQFTDLIAWNIGSASADELMAWEETSKALTYGAGVLRLWAEDVDTYLTERASLERRWEEAKENMRNLSMQAGPGYQLGMALGGKSEADMLEETRQELLSEHSTLWDTLMDRAGEAGDDLRNGPGKDSLERMVEAGLLTAGQIATYGDSYPGMVPRDIDGSEPPHQVNAWWDSLSEDEREQAMADDPDLLRDLDGIPSNVRDQLNREHLDNELAVQEGALEDLEDERSELSPGPGNETRRLELDRQIEELEGQVSTMSTLQNQLGENAGDSDRYLLAFERGEHGRAIVSHGNPDTADNVSTLVPGTNATWESVNNQSNRASALQESATDADEDADHAVISWIGYDAPQGLGAASGSSAEGAVDELNSFQDGLRATHGNTSPSHNTVIGHSYGSTVVGHTAQGDGGLNADGIVLVGSPGANADHVSELGFDPGSVHASTAENDNISATTGFTHGADPTSPEFGATVFESDEGSEGGQLPFGDAHSEYFDMETSSLEDMGEIIAGQK